MRKLLVVLICLLCCQALPAQRHLNPGTDFWVAFQPNSDNPSLIILISSDQSCSGNISSPFNGLYVPFTVAPGTTTRINLDKIYIQRMGISNRGIHIVSDNPVTVACYNHSTLPLSTDAYLALPVEVLGTDYYVMAYTQTEGGGPGMCGIVAPGDSTHVSVYNKVTNITSGITLNQGECYLFSTDQEGQDLTGSRIQSDQPVAVFSGSFLAHLPAGCFAADHIVEQMPPTHTWGKEFFTVSFGGRDQDEDYFRILAKEDLTQIQIDGISAGVINRGEFHESFLSGTHTITASAPVLVTQFAKGYECSTSNGRGDPMMIVVPPKQQYQDNFRIGTIPGFINWVNIIASPNALGKIRDNGSLLSPVLFTEIGTSGYFAARIPVADGSHHFTGPAPFEVFSYGWNNAISYGYPAGGTVSPLARVAAITLTPDSASGILGQTVMCFTATVTGSDGAPLPDILVDFRISGMGPFLDNIFTNDEGKAIFCYTRNGFTPGEDSIYAEVSDVRSTTSEGHWLLCTNPGDGGLIGPSQSECQSFIPDPIQSFSLPSGFTGEIGYQWQQSTTGATTGFTDIAGANAAGYVPGLITGNTWFRRLSKADCSAEWSPEGISNVVEVIVDSVLNPRLEITAAPDPFCMGNPVTVTATGTHGGSNPEYQWFLNGLPAGTGETEFTLMPEEGDSVRCVMTSSLSCVTINPVSSGDIILRPDLSHPAAISISATPNPFCKGNEVVLTATTANSGNHPVFEWTVNGIPQGCKTSDFLYHPADQDVIRCRMISDLYCVSNNPAISEEITLSEEEALAGFSVYPTDTTLSYPVITLNNYSSGGITCFIDWGDGGITGCDAVSHTYKTPGTFLIRQIISSMAGCTDSAFATVIIRPEYSIYIPNSFTPDGDGLNDLFRPVGNGFENYSLVVYSRSGEEIFSTRDLRSGWNGTMREHPCPEGSYAYKVEFLNPHGENVIRKGIVFLIRKH